MFYPQTTIASFLTWLQTYFRFNNHCTEFKLRLRHRTYFNNKNNYFIINTNNVEPTIQYVDVIINNIINNYKNNNRKLNDSPTKNYFLLIFVLVSFLNNVIALNSGSSYIQKQHKIKIHEIKKISWDETYSNQTCVIHK